MELAKDYRCDVSRLDAEVILEILKHRGFLLLRGSNPSLQEFNRLSDQIMTPMIHHATNTVERDPINGDSATSTVNKGQDAIPLHREGSYAPGCPDLLMLYCVRPSCHQGQTTVCDGVQLLESLPNSVRQFVGQARLKWSWQAPPSRWQAALSCKSQPEALQKLVALRLRLPNWEQLDFSFKDDILDGSFVTPCTIPTSCGTQAFCNSLLIYHLRSASKYFALELFRVTLLDGSPFPTAMLQQIAQQAERITHEINWQTQDIVIVDNSRWMHGRRAFTDDNRRVLIRMGHRIPLFIP